MENGDGSGAAARPRTYTSPNSVQSKLDQPRLQQHHALMTPPPMPTVAPTSLRNHVTKRSFPQGGNFNKLKSFWTQQERKGSSNCKRCVVRGSWGVVWGRLLTFKIVAVAIEFLNVEVFGGEC